MKELFTQLLPIVSTVIGSGAFLAIFTDRRKRAAEAKKIGSEAGKSDAEGQVALSGQTLEWSRAFSDEAAKARERAEKAEQKADAANTRADAADKRARDAEDRLDAIEDAFRELNRRIASCPITVPPGCPLQAVIQTSPPPSGD